MMSDDLRLVRLFSADGSESVPAVLIPFDDRIIAIEQDPVDFGRRFALHGRSRVYFLGADIRVEEVGRAELSQRISIQARDYVSAVVALQALASPISLLSEIQ